MQFKKLTPAHRAELAWKKRRNRIVCDMLAADPRMTRPKALSLANAAVRAKGGANNSGGGK